MDQGTSGKDSDGTGDRSAGTANEGGLSKEELRRLRKNQQQAEKAAKAAKFAAKQKNPNPTAKDPKSVEPPNTKDSSKSNKAKGGGKENIVKHPEPTVSTTSSLMVGQDKPPGFKDEPLKSILKKPTSSTDNIVGKDVTDSCYVRQQPPLVAGPVSSKGRDSPRREALSGSAPIRPKTVTVSLGAQRSKKRSIFHHIPQRCQDIAQLTACLLVRSEKIHPLVIRVGLAMNEGIISGSNIRCVAMLTALRQTIQDYERPEDKEFVRDLRDRLEAQIKFISDCRPLAVSMQNAQSFLNLSLSHLQQQQASQEHGLHAPRTASHRGKRLSDSEAKSQLVRLINNFIRDEIKLAQDGITDYAITKINAEGEVILTYGCSPVVKQILHKARYLGKHFRVMVVDSRPRLNGKDMVAFCVAHQIPVTYLYLNGISHVMRGATKVLMSAHSLLANGYVMGHVGSSMVSLVASAFNVPVLVCCETYKFCDRVDTDAFVHNELSTAPLCPPRPIASASSGPTELGSQQVPNSQVDKIGGDPTMTTKPAPFDSFNMLYDVTPPSLVSLIITEKGLLPCNSVPAVLRVRHEQSYSMEQRV